MSEALLTALVPVKAYHPPYLLAALDSLRAQTSTRWRALVVHPPRMRAELEGQLRFFLEDTRFALVGQQGPRLAGALNTGMREARTEFTAILLGDDLWAPEAVEVLSRNIADRPEVDFFHSSRRIIDGDGNPISSVYEAPQEITPEMFVEWGPVKHLLCWRRELGLAIGGIDESLESVGTDDYDFPWSMLEAGARFGAIRECLYVYRDHRACYRLTTHLPLRTSVRGMRRILRKHGVAEAEIDRHLRDACGSYLRQCLYSSRLDAWIKRALRRDPASGWRETYR